MARSTPLYLLLLGLVGCGTPSETPPTPPTVEPAAEPAGPSRVDVVVDSDLRQVTDRVRAALTSADPGVRREAALALARRREPTDVPLLRRALRDVDPTVRDAASLGLGAMEGDAPELDAVLAGALASETDPEVRAFMVRDLGRRATDRALRALGPALRSDDPRMRAAACKAVAERGLAGHDAPTAVRTRLAALLETSEPEEVRLACAYALGRLPVPRDAEVLRGATVALGLAVADPSPDVRIFAYRALSRQPDAELGPFVHGTRDDDPRVAIQAFRALAQRASLEEGGPATYSAAVRDAFARAVQGDEINDGPVFHILMVALEAAAPMARSTPIHDLAAELHRALGRAPADRPLSRDRGLAHCAAAELADRGRGWPSRIDDCGLEQVTPVERQVAEARILGDLDGAVPQRLARLRRLFESDSALVRETVVGAAAKIPHPDATALVLRALAVDDAGLRAASADAIATIARRAPAGDLVPPPLPTDAVREALATARRQASEGELETLVTWLDAVEATDARGLGDLVIGLSAHPSYAVRAKARALARAWELEVPDRAVPPPSNGIEAPRILPGEARPRVTVATRHGSFVIELRPDAAPTTVARFLGLVESGFFDGLTFHRVVPGFVVQGGDPRGDGYGGPEWWQRCEDNRLAYERGTVGMALAGRDTGGSQFFITHGPQPHLELRYTAFGQVVEGMEVVDALRPTDAIESMTLATQ